MRHGDSVATSAAAQASTTLHDVLAGRTPSVSTTPLDGTASHARYAEPARLVRRNVPARLPVTVFSRQAPGPPGLSAVSRTKEGPWTRPSRCHSATGVTADDVKTCLTAVTTVRLRPAIDPDDCQDLPPPGLATTIPCRTRRP